MLGLSDSRRFSRAPAAVGLVLGPLLFLLDALIDPAWADDDAAYLAQVAGHKGRYVIAEVASTLGALVWIVGMIGVMHLLRRRRVTLGQLAAGMVTVGLIGLTASFAFSVFDLAMADFENRAAMVHLHAELGDSFAYKAYWLIFFSAGTVLGLILLAVALLRRRIGPPWSPILLIVASVFWHVAGGERAPDALALLLITVALAPLAVRIWSLSEEDWARWEIPVEGRAGEGGLDW
jgi:Domain of unknown function (DUF4386)